MRVVREGIAVGAGQVAAALGTLVGIRLLTEFTHPTTFGTLSLLLGVAVFAQSLSTTPLMQSMLRFYPDCISKGTDGYLRRISMGVLLKVCAVVGTILLAGWQLWRARYGGNAWTGGLLAVMLIVDAVRGFEVTLLNAARRQAPMALWTGLEAWLRPAVAVILLIWLGESAEALLLGYVSASTGLLFLFRYALRETTKAHTRAERNFSIDDQDLPRRMAKYALPLVPLAIVGWISAQADRYIIGGTLDLATVGVYSAMYGLVSRPFLLAGTAVEQTLRPVLYQAIANGDERKSRLVERRWFLALVFVSIGGIGGFMLLHRMLSTLFLGESYRNYSYLMPWLAVGYSFSILAQFYERLCYAHDRTIAVLWIETAGAITSILLAIPLIRVYGIEGAAWAVPGYFFLQMALARHLAKKPTRRLSNKVAGEVQL